MLAVKGGKICTMGNQGIVEDGVIIIEGDRIIALGRNLTIPQDAYIIEAQNSWIVPGLIDAHSHLGLEEEIYRIEGDDVNEMSDPITPYLRALDGVNFWDIGFRDALKGGVTRTLCLPGSANIIGGQAVLLKNWAENKTEMVYEEIWGLKAALGENPKRVYGQQKKAPMTRMANAALLRESLFQAQEEMDKSPDNKDFFRKEPLFRILKKEMPILIHVHRADDILTAIRIKEEFDIDMVIQHGTEAAFVAKELKHSNIPVCLGPLLVNRAKVEMKEVAFESAADLFSKGVKFCLITDHPVVPIEHLRLCAALAARAGLDEEEALKAITLNPAEILKIDHEVGSLQVGKKADIAIFSEHPFKITAVVEKIIIDGRVWRDQFE